MKIINQTANLTADRKTAYNMTNGTGIHKMTEAKDAVLNIKAAIIYEDTNSQTGEINTVVSILADEGSCYASNSKSFVRDFTAMVEVFGIDEVKTIKVVGCASRSGRSYLRAELA